mgnify:CR=1 FL=1
MARTGRPKLDPLEKALRKGKRLKVKIQELEMLYQSDPSGPAAPSRPGRPPVSYKTQLERAIREYRELKVEIKGLALAKGEAVKSVEAKIRETEDPTLQSNVGRPTASYVVKLEYKIRLKEARIERIRSGEETKRRLERKASPGSHLGRKPKDDFKKIARLEDQVLAMKAEVRAIEQSMTAREHEDLEIHRMRRNASNLRKVLRDEGLDDLRIEAHKDWEGAKSDRSRFPGQVLECCALERAIDERVKKFKETGRNGFVGTGTADD